MRTVRALSLLCGLSAAAAQAFQPDEATDLLRKSMERSKQIPVVAILQQRSVGGPSAAIQVKIEQSRDGITKLTVLQPLSMEGTTYIDDGKSWRTYLPDKQHLIVQDSPRLRQQNLGARMELAAQNYRFKIEQAVTIAGRKALPIVAAPRTKDMATCRYYVDAETSFLLRMETVGPDKVGTCQLDTKHIRYPKTAVKEAFSIELLRTPRKFDCQTPSKMTSTESAKTKLGFAPVVPKQLPYGFKVQEPQIAGGDDFRFAAIRLTDGLVNATIYQWAGGHEDLPKAFHQQKGDRTVKGVRFRFVGDVPEPAKAEFMELFTKEAMRAIKSRVEPEAPRSALKSDRKELLNMLLYSIQNSAVEEQTSHTGPCAFSRTRGL